jgi:bifunctional DNase/RNase
VDEVYYATVVVRRGRGRPVEVDARPSDAVSLALCAGAPMFVAEELLADPSDG